MFDVFQHTPEEKEQDIADMLRQGSTYKQIMRECHVSPCTISNVRSSMLGYTQDNSSKKADQISKETQALKLFNEGKKPIEVAIELDIETDYVISIYQKFQRLRSLEGFISSYEHVKGNIGPFLQLYDLMISLGMTPEQVAEQVKHGYNLPYLGSIHIKLSSEVCAFGSQKQSLEINMNFMQNQIEEYFKSLQYFNNEIEIKNSELAALAYEINEKRILVQNLENHEVYIRIKEDTKKEAKIMMQNNYVLSAVTLTATLEAIRRYPDNQSLMLAIVSTENYSTMPYEQALIESHKPQLLRLIGNVQNEIAEQITGMVVAAATKPVLRAPNGVSKKST